MSNGEQRHTSHSPEETRRIAGALARGLPARATLALHGELGSGKTCFVGGLAAALGVTRAVTSPTFTVIHEYRGTRPLYHVDLYRIRGPDEALALGLEEYLEADGLTAIEWAEKVADLLPAGTIHVFFEAGPGETERSITIRL